VQPDDVDGKLGVTSVVDAEERMGERALVETGVRALGEPEQVTFGVLAAGEAACMSM